MLNFRRELRFVFFSFFALALSETSHAGLVSATVWGKTHETDPLTQQDYIGPAAGLPGLGVSLFDPNGGRSVSATLDSSSMRVESQIEATGLFDAPAAYAGIHGGLTFANNQALQDMITANAGQPLDMFATFYMSFNLSMLYVPGGLFGQSGTDTQALISADNSLTNTGMNARLQAGNGVDNYYIGTSGALTTGLIGAGFFEVQVPFRISNASSDQLTINFFSRISSSSLGMSSNFPIGSSVQLLYPAMGDVFIQSGPSAALAGLEFELNPTPSAVPEPGSLVLSACFAAGLIAQSLRSRRQLRPRNQGRILKVQP